MPIRLPHAPVLAYIGLGANLGHPLHTLHRVIDELQQVPGIKNSRCSKFYKTAPVDGTGPDYVNAVLSCHTTLSANDLLLSLMLLEAHHGRDRPYTNAPRTLDLDLLIYDDRTINTPHLIIPHPRMHQRAFVLKPLLDLDPELTLKQGAVDSLLEQCENQAIEVLA